MASLEKTSKLMRCKLTAMFTLVMLASVLSSVHAYDADLAWVYETGSRPAPVLSSKSAVLTGGMESRRMSSACSSVTINDLETRAYSRAASGAVDVDARKPSGMFMIIR